MNQPIRSDRFIHQIRSTQKLLQLDLKDKTVVTEAATGAFACTPVLAALSGAHVIAHAKASAFGSMAEASDQVLELARTFDVEKHIVIAEEKMHPDMRGADIVINAGHLRPLDKAFLEHIGRQTVVSYMCEGWEVRPGDIDLDFCKQSEIPVYSTDEDAWGMGVFSMCGMLAVKLYLEAGLELSKNRVLVISSDKFGPVIENALGHFAHCVRLYSPNQDPSIPEGPWDAVVVAEYTDSRVILGETVSFKEFCSVLNPGAVVIQFAGKNDVQQLEALKVSVYPNQPLAPHRMSKTLAYLGTLPVVRLQAMGLKVGQAASDGKKQGLSGKELDYFVLANAPAEECL